MVKYLYKNKDRLCTVSSDNRCFVTSTMWGVIRIVSNYINTKVPLLAYVGNIGDEEIIRLSSIAVPVGYEMKLVALELLIYIKADKFTLKLKEAAKHLYERQPENPFYAYLNGLDATDLTLKYIPKSDVKDRYYWILQEDTAVWYIKQRRDDLGSWLFLLGILLNK